MDRRRSPRRSRRNELEVIPSARRLVHSLRDLGYDFSQAVADIVDNSIAARASRVTVDIEFESDDSWVCIGDNGKGMTPDRLREAMRFGSAGEYEADDLGKFGLGLKSASLSQCRRLTVASRTSKERARVTAYSWDLDHLESKDRWEVLPTAMSDLPGPIQDRLQNTTGTVVFWQRLDRILGYKHPYGESAKRQILLMCRELELHLGMVFHNFLAGGIKRRPLSISLNGNKVAAWDPYCRSEPKTRALGRLKIPLVLDDVAGEVVLEPYVLPPQSKFSSPEAFHRAGGPAKWNLQQGFYIYRANRMIQSGGWCHLQAPDEHTKLARVSLSFSPALDEAFRVNVTKTRVYLPSQIRAEVQKAIGPVLKLARSSYTASATGDSGLGSMEGEASRGLGSPDGHVRNSGPTMSETTAGGVRVGSPDPLRSGRLEADELLTFDQWSARVLQSTTNEERPLLETIFDRVRSTHRPAQVDAIEDKVAP
jgi:histidine kinase/DNA gyrase B/HSP90-like ATPase